MTAPLQLADEQHPWIGLSSFTEDDRAFFAGRGEEIDELLRLVRRDTLTLLYGVSGLGKTSLLQAGLFPALRAEDYLPVPIRLDYMDGAAPITQQVLSAIAKASVAASVEAPAPLPARDALGLLPSGKQSLLESAQRPRHAVSGLRSIRGMLHSRPRDRRTCNGGAQPS